MPTHDRIPYRYSYGPQQARASMPLGGLGTGMVSLSANGSLEHVSVRHNPAMHHEPWLVASLHSRTGGWTRMCNGQQPDHRICKSALHHFGGSGSGAGNFGLPCYRHYEMRAAFPICEIDLHDEQVPVDCTICGWSPFIPGDDASASLPMARLEYEFHNRSEQAEELVFGYHAENFLQFQDKKNPRKSIARMDRGFALTTAYTEDGGDCGCEDGNCEKPAATVPVVSFAVRLDDPNTVVDAAWFRSGWFDIKTNRWDVIRQGIVADKEPHEGDQGPGGSAQCVFTLQPGERRRIAVTLCWHQKTFHMMERLDWECNDAWSARFDCIEDLADHIDSQVDELRTRTVAFTRALHDSDLPPELIEAVARPLAILKSPTLHRLADGRIWGWEGCHDGVGCCAGSCTHVYNYAQALPFLFPQLERSLRNTEFIESQNEEGHQNFRAPLPIDPACCNHKMHAAADGQLGGLVQMYREWRLCGDDAWLRQRWPAMRQSLEYCIDLWDPDRCGRLAEPHHNTYDIEFWGEDGLCSVIYAGALKAMIAMADHLGEDSADWPTIAEGLQAVIRDELYDGWLRQKVHWKDLRADDPSAVAIGMRIDSPECNAVIEQEGPRYQYGRGVLTDAVLGCYCARIAGLGAIIDEEIEDAQLAAIMRYNFKPELFQHACAQRPSYAVADEGGLIMCSWPDGGRPTMPFVYSDEVWTGAEHHIASHLCLRGRIDEAIAIERAVQGRYDGRRRNPFDEYECGHYYYRALSSYGILMGLSGARYDAVEKVLHLEPRVAGDFRCFFAVGSAWGQVGVRDGQPFIDLVEGELAIERIAYTACAQ